LLGTFHIKSGEYLDSIPGAMTALQSCKQVVGELNMSDMAGMQMQSQQAMMMTPDTTYRMLYSDEDYQFVSEAIALLTGGAGLDQLGMLKPSAIQMTVVMLAYIKHFPGFNPMNMLDGRVQSEAVKEQKPVLALETIEHQLYILYGMMSLQRQADVLLCNLRNMDDAFDLISELIESYNKFDLNYLDELFQQESEICPSTPEEVAALNKDRNHAWMQKLPAIMKEKSSFIAVGALHLGGEDGLLNLLEKEGYRVEAAR
jgi:uncharacterized protein YbaP (TraB family)